MEVDNKVFVIGKVAVEEEKAAKLICQKIIPFSNLPREIWIKFKDKEHFIKNEQKLYDILGEYDGNDGICIYLEYEKAIKHLPKSKNVKADKEVLERLYDIFEEENVKVVEKSIEKLNGKG